MSDITVKKKYTYTSEKSIVITFSEKNYIKDEKNSAV